LLCSVNGAVDVLPCSTCAYLNGGPVLTCAGADARRSVVSAEQGSGRGRPSGPPGRSRRVGSGRRRRRTAWLEQGEAAGSWPPTGQEESFFERGGLPGYELRPLDDAAAAAWLGTARPNSHHPWTTNRGTVGGPAAPGRFSPRVRLRPAGGASRRR
jgi:hypothetical protein